MVEFYLSPKGRTGRRDYWLYCAWPLVLLQLLASIGDIYLIRAWPQMIGLVSVTVGAIVLWPAIAVSTKRLHDRGKQGWWLLLLLVPLVGGVWYIIEVGLLKGDDGPNDYGPEPGLAAPSPHAV